MDFYIAEDYVRSRCKSNSMSLQKRDGRVPLNGIKAADEKKLSPADDNNKLPSSALKIRMFTSTSDSCSSSFLEDVLINFFAS